MSSWSWKTGLASATILAAMAYAVAQTPTGHDGMHAQAGPGAQGQQPMSARARNVTGRCDRPHDADDRMASGSARCGAANLNDGDLQSGAAGQPSPCRDRRRSGQSRRSVQILERSDHSWSQGRESHSLRRRAGRANSTPTSAEAVAAARDFAATSMGLESGVESRLGGPRFRAIVAETLVPAHVGDSSSRLGRQDGRPKWSEAHVRP